MLRGVQLVLRSFLVPLHHHRTAGNEDEHCQALMLYNRHYALCRQHRWIFPALHWERTPWPLVLCK